MGILTIFLSLLFFVAMGFAYCVGWDYVKRELPDHLVHYYMIAAFLRFVLVALVVLAYIKLSGEPKDILIKFALMFMAMYVVMMIVTMKLRHQ